MPYAREHCRSCLKLYAPRRHDQTCCSTKCKKAEINLEANRGRQIYSLAMGWRFDRKNSQKYLKALCRILSRFREEDRLAGRKLPRLYPEQVAQMGLSVSPRAYEAKGMSPVTATQLTPWEIGPEEMSRLTNCVRGGTVAIKT